MSPPKGCSPIGHPYTRDLFLHQSLQADIGKRMLSSPPASLLPRYGRNRIRAGRQTKTQLKMSDSSQYLPSPTPLSESIYRWQSTVNTYREPSPYFFFNLVCSILPKNASPLDTRVSESSSHIQTHLILNITIACCITYPAVSPTPSARSQGRAAWHMTTMRIIMRQDWGLCRYLPATLGCYSLRSQ